MEKCNIMVINRRKYKRFFNKGRRRIAAAFKSLKSEGVICTVAKTLRILSADRRIAFSEWMKTPLFSADQLQAQRLRVFEKNIKFSIITPLFNTPEDFLREMIESVIAQTYPNWELCLADGSDDEHGYVRRICMEYSKKDSRIRYKKLTQNLGIAGNSNECIRMADGEYISLLDHDDLLHPAALHEVMDAICSREADFVYTDELTFNSPDKEDVSVIHFKPDYAPDTLLVNNYICHFVSFRRSLLDHCGAFRSGYDGSQDHELFLRMTKEAKQIIHIPEVLYYWRAHPESAAETVGNKQYASEAGIKAIRDFLKSEGIDASVGLAKGIPTIYRVSYPLPSPEPLVSIIIPNCDHADDLRACIESVREKTSYRNYEIIIVENNSTLRKTFEYYRKLSSESDNVKIIRWKGNEFNWSAINNYAAEKAASGEYLLLLNNDMTVISPGWIEEMLMYAQRSDVGAVGAMLYYPDDTIQHAGVILGMGGVAAHAFNVFRRGSVGYMGRLCYAQNLSAVTGACMMIRRTVWEEVGGINEQFAVNYNDIDLCLRIREAGYLIVWTPYAELYHYESKSRGGIDTPEKRDGLAREKLLFRKRWYDVLEKGDPYYNPNLTLRRSDFSLKNRKYE